MNKVNQILLILLILLIISLIVVGAIALTMHKPYIPPTPQSAPKLVGWNIRTGLLTWPVKTWYRYAYTDLANSETGPWSDASDVIESVRFADPILEIIPTGTTVVAWQRKTETNNNWQDVALLPLEQQVILERSDIPISISIDDVALTTSARTKSVMYMDTNNPAGLPPAPSSSPLPATATTSKFVDRRGLTWNKRNQPAWALQTRFACRFVGSGPSAWSLWSAGVWFSAEYNEPVLWLPQAANTSVQYSGSWLVISKENNDVSMNFEWRGSRESTFVRKSLSVGLSTVDSVLNEIRDLCKSQAGVSLVVDFCPQTSLVSLGVIDSDEPNARAPYMSELAGFNVFLTGSSVFRSLGFTTAVLHGLPGFKHTANTAPNIEFRPETAQPSSNGVVIVPHYSHYSHHSHHSHDSAFSEK
jgi:hypothetical protein